MLKLSEIEIKNHRAYISRFFGSANPKILIDVEQRMGRIYIISIKNQDILSYGLVAYIVSIQDLKKENRLYHDIFYLLKIPSFSYNDYHFDLYYKINNDHMKIYNINIFTNDLYITTYSINESIIYKNSYIALEYSSKHKSIFTLEGVL